MTDLAGQAKRIVEALREKPDLYHEVLLLVRGERILGRWIQRGDEWIRRDLGDAVRLMVGWDTEEETWGYRLRGGRWRGNFASREMAVIAAEVAARDEGWLLA